ncbi:metallophosphoesterase [Brachybacterium sp. GU-2]|uniref:metallophosphoesterase n=1 Tax=Brachybacterium sp. GU-2 TaxID=3069708 RepID=UPI00280C31FB|nr:metallophosphoesterase [Brachybacterium sp. GU-2]WME22285.1 metallophosphoesterase [Brachybacterium sp. GU-2]
MRPALAAAGALGGVGLGLAGAAHVWARHVEIHRYTLREAELRILPTGARTRRVLHISDIHLLPDQHRKLAFLEHLESLRPHLVIDTGDNIASAAAVPALAQAIEPLLRRPGAFVMGSNDMFEPMPKNPARYLLPDPRPAGLTAPREPTLPTAELAARLSEHGWKDLTNTRATIELGGLEVRLAGVDDPHLERDRMPALPSPAPRTPEHGNVLQVGVAHAPYRRVLDAFVADGAELILAGHTHGGQLRLPGIGALVTNCDLPRQQARGLSDWQGVPMNVSAGMGASPYSNYRLLTPPEATLLTLRARRPSDVG